MPALSVVIPATDAPATLPRCLAAIRRADHPPDEVVVVDAPRGRSPAAARNDGAGRAGGEVLVFVDADVEVHADAFGRIRDAFAADPGLTALSGAYDDTPAAPGTVSVFRNLLHHHVHREGAGPAETFWTGLGAVRRSAFLEAGGFDERRFPHPSVEDVELGRRLHVRGARLVLDPTVAGTHLKRWTLRSMVWTDFARRGVPWAALLARDRRFSSALNLGWRHRASAAAAVLAVVAAVPAPPAAAAAVGALVWLNRRFYGLLLRRLGPRRAALGVILHGVHHLVGVAAVPVGLVRGLREIRSVAAAGTSPGTEVGTAPMERPGP